MPTSCSAADLDRSPSLSSNSSGVSSVHSLNPATPALAPASSFPSPQLKEYTDSIPHQHDHVPLGNTANRATRGSIGNLAAYSRDGGKSPISVRAQPWSSGHRTGAGVSSFDSARDKFGPVGRSPSLRTGLLNQPTPESPSEDKVAAWRYSSATSSPTLTSPTSRGALPRPPLSPTRVPTDHRSTSPTSYARPSSRTSSTSPTRIAHPLPPLDPHFSSSASARIRASSIFSTRDAPVPANLHPPSPLVNSDLSRSVVGSVRGLQDGSSYARGHRRAMTLPQLGAGGLPLPPDANATLAAGEEVAGRVRLSRPAESPSPFAPSAVFSSSHGLNRAAQGARPGGGLLPSQTVRAIDRQRQDLVAYEYLCHVAEAREWLQKTIGGRADARLLGGESIGDFEQSLRNGYALAWLGRVLGGEACAGSIYNDPKLQYRHTGNIDIFFTFLKVVELPEIFRFETIDLYDAKNLPKVIYCVHALSILLARRGMADGMSNLVGQIEFTDDEVNATQKNLSGVRMPNFGGIGKAMAIKEEPEPETEEDRRARLLNAALPGIIGLQAHGRGALGRRRFASLQRRERALQAERQRAIDAENARLAEEELLRAEEQRRVEEAERRAAEVERQRVIEVQKRQLEEEARQRAEDERRRKEEERRRIEEEHRLAEEERRRVEEERRRAEEERIQAIEDERLRHEAAVQEAGRVLVGFQAASRGCLTRRKFFAGIEDLERHEDGIVGFQAVARGVLARRTYDETRDGLHNAIGDIVAFQAVARSVLARQRLLERIHSLRSNESVMVSVQAQIRGTLARQAFASKKRDLRSVAVHRSVGGFQALARASLVQRQVKVQKKELGFVEPDVVQIQAQVRGYLGREAFLDHQDYMRSCENDIVDLQSLIRGHLARQRFNRIRNHFKHELSKVVRLQAAIRSRRQGSQYRQLRMGTNVPVSAIKNFVRLLDDSEFDYREELQVEALRQQLVKAIRETQALEDDVKDLDTKIALLVKNKITHEVARAQRAAAGGLGANARNSLLSAAGDPFSSNALDRQTQQKLELYQQLFGLLQTSPAYLSRLFANTGRAGISEKLQKSLESTTFIVFGYAQNQREEFLLLKLFQRSVLEEMAQMPDAASFARGNFTFIRLLMQYGRGVNQRKYLKDLLTTQVTAVIRATTLDFGCDPLSIYRAEIAKEEMTTGVATARALSVNYREALWDPETKRIFTEHLLAIKNTTSAFLQAMYASTSRIPFGIRYIGREVFRALRAQFPNDPEEDALRVVAHLVYYRFIQPAAVAPETFDIIEGVVPALQRKNLAEVCKMLNQISVGRLFDSELPYMTPLNNFIGTSSESFVRWIKDVIDVQDAEVFFRADEYLDATAARRPVIYISPNDIYATHSIISDNLDLIAPEANDPLRTIISQLGGVPMASNPELVRARADEVPLTLMTRLQANDDPEAGKKALFNQAKRRVLAILKVHHGADLEAVLTKAVTEDDEDAWARVVQEEREEEHRQAQQQQRKMIATANDIRNMSFHQLKQATLQDVVQLRSQGVVNRADKYQAILDAIALDISSKGRRRVQRQAELSSMHAALTSLRDKKKSLDDQKDSYYSYIRESMTSIQKKGKKRLVLPWSMQGIHQRQLEKNGKRYQFGSFKYSAQTLYDRGILLSIDQYSPRQFGNISLTISSDEICVFEISASYLGLKVTTVELKLEDLLEMQFAGKQTISIGDVAKLDKKFLA
ncbi:Ras GTPase-activating-like protein IQGAP2/3, partial [Phenoliferia sp. Uapishka_3]